MMRGKNIGIIVIAVMMICPIWTNAQDLFIKNGTLLTVTKGKIENGDIVIRNGIIQRSAGIWLLLRESKSSMRQGSM